MPKKYKNEVHLVALTSSLDVVKDELCPLNDALQTFSDLVSLHLRFGFGIVRVFRIVSGGHVLYEFRDVRRLQSQRSFDDPKNYMTC